MAGDGKRKLRHFIEMKLQGKARLIWPLIIRPLHDVVNPLRTYRIALGKNPNGPKEREGDNKTPEGTYLIDSRNDNSRFHLSLHLSCPNEKDKKRAKSLGVPPGGSITIHGIKNGLERPDSVHQWSDSTEGCIAVTNREIEEIWQLVPNGIIVEVRP